MYEPELYRNSIREALFAGLLNSIETRYGTADQMLPVVPWAEGLLLDGQPFSMAQHEYQRDLLAEVAPRQVFLKGAQVGVTSIQMLRTLHGLISKRYPQGCLYLFPSRTDVLDFSRGRFNPLITDNECIARHVQDTDTVGIKRIGGSMLYLRGARSTGKAGGMKRTSTQLKSIPADRIIFDEYDEMESGMVDLALERLSHSSVREEVYLSTPTIPDYGVDKLFQDSDQRHWFIRCQKCGGETCLELTFPDCLEELPDGKVIRLCRKCRDREISPQDGRWTALYPERGKNLLVGWRISQLNSMFVDPGRILSLFRDPPNGNISEVYNSKLAQAHVAAENRLSPADVLRLCGDVPVAEEDKGPCYLGADVGSLIHCVIARKNRSTKPQVVYTGSSPDWAHLETLMRRFKVVRAVIDALPETRKAREFARKYPGKVYVCYYSEHQKGGYSWNDSEQSVSCNRTEALDASHAELASGGIILPRECDTMHEFARQCSNVARVLQTDPETGLSRYTYLKTGPDHYRHAQSYECMARQSCPEFLFPFI